jgi:hypothetical protein
MGKLMKKEDLKKDAQRFSGSKPIMVECGECYTKYDLRVNENCPNCGSEEIVGVR